MTKSHANPEERPAVSDSETTAPTAPSYEAVARRAHELYEARGCRHGCDLDDWLQAEQELCAESSKD